MGGFGQAERDDFDTGVFLDTPTTHSDNLLFRRFWELGGGPLGQTSGCYQNFCAFRHFLNLDWSCPWVATF